MPWRTSASLLRFRRYLILGNLVVLAMVVLVALQVAHASYQTHEARARQSAANLAQTLSQSVSAGLKLVDNSLQTTLKRLDELQARGVADPRELARIAEEQRSLVPAVDALRVTDASGLVLNPGDRPAVSMADRDYFQAAKAEPTRTVVSEPVRGRLIGGWGLAIARARTAADGSFLGVVYASIKAERFRDDFKRADVGAQGAVTLRSGSLQLIARHSLLDANPEAGTGTAKVSDQLRAALAHDPKRGSFVTRTVLDGIERVTAYEAVPDYPMLLLVGLATDDFYTAWRREVAVLAALMLLLEALLVAFSVFIYRAQARQVKERGRVELLAAERGALLDNELIAMVRLRDRREVWHNAALAQLFGYEPGELSGQPSRLLYLDDESYAQVGRAYQHQLETLRSYRTQLRMRRKDGSAIWIDLSGTALPDGESLWLLLDISAIKHSEEQARHLAFHDVLTGLPNRHLLFESLAFMLRDAGRNDRWLAICYLDLDGFKAVNDTRGHDAGDAVLRAAAERLTANVRINDVVARIGGDEFVLVLNQLGGLSDERHALNRLLDAFEAPFPLPGGGSAQVGISIGVAMYPRHGKDVNTLITRADQAMLAGKRAGKGRWVMVEDEPT
ncbi:diguanylate cyclase (GGDEF)-like protein/PAS domain S-box-containing protein [Pelomonas saccharophila]|uniref:Diguanylate cyclase (GGDEF)-like protein/PAS domain S-box-containing protein n=1 Tax=Roseateles saccharophilus TaxID=304 RepID=A0ABU1YMQ2_ROSSA|nr:diguanylate cyclase [Roseateles saccharophilus]MDR7270143.1 diguanylate cyclase (GGDEF)-like protein/PAS domain S-box-containing protein [Roseateles saccharophilus]